MCKLQSEPSLFLCFKIYIYVCVCVCVCITLFWLLGTLLGLIIKCNLCFQSKYLGLSCKQFLKINEPNKSWGERRDVTPKWKWNSLSHILCFFPWRGWGRGITRFWKKLATFSLWFLFGIDFEDHQLFTIWCIRSQIPFNSCFEPTTSQEKGPVIITSLVLFIYKHQYSNLFKFAPTSVKLIN